MSSIQFAVSGRASPDLGNVFIFCCVVLLMYDPEKLELYKRVVVFAGEIKKITLGFPGFEMYELGRQMRKASDSIGANIREGCGKRTSKDYVYFLYNASGSAKEMKHHVNSAFRDGYIGEEQMDKFLRELEEISKMIYGVIKYVEKRDVR